MKKQMFSISMGNSKLGGIPSFSLRPVTDCPNHEHCARFCYDRRHCYRRFKSVRELRDLNAKFVTTDPEWWGKLIGAISLINPDVFRVHVGGDFVCPEYTWGWARIALALHHVRFYAFTKAFNIVGRVDWPPNFELVYSMVPGMRIPTNPGGWRYFFLDAGPDTKYPGTLQKRYEAAVPCPGSCESCGMCHQLKKLGVDVRVKQH